MKRMPLRYNISSWNQLPGCLSNNSQQYHIHIGRFAEINHMEGLRITVEHEKYGIVFATLINATGDLISRDPDQSLLETPVSKDLTTEQILQELYKFGFDITFDRRKNLPGLQIKYLMDIKELGFDKIRKLRVWKATSGEKLAKTEIVAFSSEANPMWLNAGYSASYIEFAEACANGSALNVTHRPETREFNWDWLDYVANVDDIARDNAGEVQ